MTTEERVKKIIQEHLGVNEARVIPSAKVEEDLGADSLDIIELVMAIEEDFTIEITDDEALKCETVQSIYDLVRTKLDLEKTI